MNSKLASILSKTNCVEQGDGIFVSKTPEISDLQKDEVVLRERIAKIIYDDYFNIIAKNHSIPVMDSEVDRFIAKMPEGAIILDIGGCWGWHWRRIAKNRPDIGVLIIDFVRNNLAHALNVLGPLVGTQVALMHADATALPFATTNEGIFDGIWTVQTFQHIPDFTKAIKESHRVLKPRGYFINYSLHKTPLNRSVYKILGKSYHCEGMVKGSFYLARANDHQLEIIEKIFASKVVEGFAECLFHPDLKLTFTGRPGSLIGRLDVFFSHIRSLAFLIARQRIFLVSK